MGHPPVKAAEGQRMQEPMPIDSGSEFGLDWDWFATDEEGRIAHFTSAGVRNLPRSVKANRAVTEQLAEYFINQAKERGDYRIRPGAEFDAGDWKTPKIKELVMVCYGSMAAKGLFSYNTNFDYSPGGNYYLIGIPTSPMCLTESASGDRG